jgi:hypothetical protein
VYKVGWRNTDCGLWIVDCIRIWGRTRDLSGLQGRELQARAVVYMCKSSKDAQCSVYTRIRRCHGTVCSQLAAKSGAQAPRTTASRHVRKPSSTHQSIAVVDCPVYIALPKLYRVYFLATACSLEPRPRRLRD